MILIRKITILTTAAACSLAFLPVSGEETPVGEQPVAVSEVPQALRTAVEKAVPGIWFTGAETETYRGGNVYELQGYANNQEYETLISPDGSIIRTEINFDEDDWEGREIKLADVPAEILAAAEKAAPGVRFREAETNSGIYELEGRADEYDCEIKLAGNGRILQMTCEERGFFSRLFGSIF